jgi:hypothetical protein
VALLHRAVVTVEIYITCGRSQRLPVGPSNLSAVMIFVHACPKSVRKAASFDAYLDRAAWEDR